LTGFAGRLALEDGSGN